MVETIINGTFDNGFVNWTVTGTGNREIVQAAGNAVRTSFDNSATDVVLTQTVSVRPNEVASFSLDFGKIGMGDAFAGISTRVYHILDGEQIVLFGARMGDGNGPGINNATPAALDRRISGNFNIPDGVTELVIEIADATNVTNAVDLVFDNVSLDVTCFCQGTMIDTRDGKIAVENLRTGDLIRTARNGYQPVLWVGNRQVPAKGKLAPVRIPAHALGNSLPERDLLVSRQHRVLIRTQLVRDMFNATEILVPANKLVGVQGIEIDESCKFVTYYHILLENHEVIFSEGAETESLYLGPHALNTMSPEAMEELQLIFPELLQNPAEFPSEYLLASQKDAKVLMRQHEQRSLKQLQ